jgi:hypothetical protein
MYYISEKCVYAAAARRYAPTRASKENAPLRGALNEGDAVLKPELRRGW